MRVRAGKNRQAWRIREFLSDKGLTMADVGRAVGASNYLMSETVRGIRNNRKILAYLRDLGCPARFLDLPEDLKSKDAA
ncbi:hypothetical protein [Fundidesulfovibrio agrisoli]|uniref:hypothetical protein n=1 Tax=Fundidesulfovibrio agrisoli TaxID=2922717 RepID=UPI001FAC64C0|nr:hypothetical protein [Fundidesulfovibrio agrisoli]